MCLEEVLKLGICGKDGEVGLLLEVAWDGRRRRGLRDLRFDGCGWYWRGFSVCGLVFFET